MTANTFQFICPACGTVLHFAGENAGQSGECKRCGARITLPDVVSETNDSSDEYWFYAKTYGYGWGLPACWQGWAVLAGYIVLNLAPLPFLPIVARWIPGEVCIVVLLANTIVLSGILWHICRKKGEPLAWRWGEKTAASRKANPRGYLVFHVFLGPVLLLAGCQLYFFPPASVNGIYGYKTAAAFQSQDAWDEAQRYSAKVMIGLALATLLLQGLAIRATRPEVSILVSVVPLLVAVIAVVPITEAHLKHTFDQHGNRIVHSSIQR